MKKLFFLLFILCWHYPMCFAETIIINDLVYELDESGKTAQLTGYNDSKPSGVLEIPDTIIFGDEEYSVTTIAQRTFYGCSDITAVRIGNNITTIGDRAFYGCSGILKVEISDLSAWCKITFTHFTSNPLYYAHWLWIEDVQISDLIIPDDVSAISSYAFYGASSLTSVIIPESVKTLGYAAFNGCTELKNVTLNEGLTSIGGYAFYECENLTSIDIPYSVTSIGYAGFAYCYKLNSLKLGRGLTSLGDWIFGYCTKLNSVEIPNTVTSIGYRTFEGCSSLEEIKLPNSVSMIDDFAFVDCSSLTSVTLGNGLTSIGMGAFEGCDALAIVNSYQTAPPSIMSNSFEDEASKVLHVVEGEYDKYATSDNWKDFGEIIDDLEPDGNDSTGNGEVESGIFEIIQDDGNQITDIYNIDGKLVLRHAAKQNLKSLSPGIYITKGKKILINQNY